MIPYYIKLFQNFREILLTALFARDIFIGDAVVQVNEVVVGDISHDEALALLAGAGDTVTLLLKHYKAATPFLLKQFGRCLSPFSSSSAQS